MRAVAILVWATLVLALVFPSLRQLAGPARRRRPSQPRDELVKDPVCQTYVARSRAVRSEARGAPVYFCSEACARRHVSG